MQKKLFLYAVQSLSASDLAAIFFAALAVTLTGIFPVCANALIFEKGIAQGGMNVLMSCALLLIGTGISAVLFQMIREILLAKMKTRISISIESAAMMRVLSLPAGFFRRYSTGELAGRMQDLSGVCGMRLEAVLMGGHGCAYVCCLYDTGSYLCTVADRKCAFDPVFPFDIVPDTDIGKNSSGT